MARRGRPSKGSSAQKSEPQPTPAFESNQSRRRARSLTQNPLSPTATRSEPAGGFFRPNRPITKPSTANGSHQKLGKRKYEAEEDEQAKMLQIFQSIKERRAEESKDLRRLFQCGVQSMKSSQREVEKLESSLQTLEHSFQTLEHSLQKKDRVIKEQEQLHQEISANALKCENSRWNPEQEKDIKFAVEGLQKSIRDWAKQYAVQSLIPVFYHGGTTLELLVQQIRQIATFECAESAHDLDRPFLFLAAVLSEYIRRTVLDNHYFHFEAPNSYGIYDMFSFASKSNQIYKDLVKVDHQKANWMKKTIFRHEFPATRSPSTKRASLDEPLCPESIDQNLLIYKYQTIQDDFLNGPAGLLVDELEQSKTVEMNEELRKILWRAGNIHFCLQTQQAAFTWIAPRLLLGKTYLERNRQMVPDTSQGGDSSEGNEVRIVIGTGLLAWGDAAGDTYSKWRVVAPSPVLLRVEGGSNESLSLVDEETLQGDEEIEDSLQGGEKLEDSLQEDEEVGESLHGDEEVGDSLHGDEKVDETLQEDEEIKSSLQGGEKVDDSLQEDEKVDNSLQGDEEIGDFLREDEEVEDSLQGGEEIDDSPQEDGEIEDCIQEGEKVKDFLQGDEEIGDSLQEDEEVEDSLQGDEEIDDLLQGGEEIDDSPQEEGKIEDCIQGDEEVKDLLQVVEEIDVSSQEDGEIEDLDTKYEQERCTCC